MPAAGYRLHAIDAAGISRTSLRAAARAVLKVIPAMLEARRIIAATGPDVLLGGGGYIAGIGGAAAVTLGVPIVLTEADSHIGLSNRMLVRFASRLCLAFPVEGRGGGRYRVTGRPVPAVKGGRAEARARFGIAPDAVCVLVTGGSLGARSINQSSIEAFADSGFEVLHLAGVRDLPTLRSPRAGYHLEGYVDRFGEAVLACDLAVARAGGSVFELAAHGCPAVLVPYPHAAGDHQTGNARWMERAGAAVIVPDAELEPEMLLRTVEGLLGDRARLEGMSAASASLARPEAASEVADEVVAAAGKGRSA